MSVASEIETVPAEEYRRLHAEVERVAGERAALVDEVASLTHRLKRAEHLRSEREMAMRTTAEHLMRWLVGQAATEWVCKMPVNALEHIGKELAEIGEHQEAWMADRVVREGRRS